MKRGVVMIVNLETGQYKNSPNAWKVASKTALRDLIAEKKRGGKKKSWTTTLGHKLFSSGFNLLSCWNRHRAKACFGNVACDKVCALLATILNVKSQFFWYTFRSFGTMR